MGHEAGGILSEMGDGNMRNADESVKNIEDVSRRIGVARGAFTVLDDFDAWDEEVRDEMQTVLDDMFAQAATAPEMSLDEINAEIAEVRRARRAMK